MIKNKAQFGLVEHHGVPRDLESVDGLIHKKDDRASKEFEKWAIRSSKMTNIIA